MSSAAAEYLNSTWNRDKVMGVLQFAPMVLAAPVEAATGRKAWAESLLNLSAMADYYRAITRLSLLLGSLSRQKIKSVQKIDVPGRKQVATVDWLCDVLFSPFEHLALLSKAGVLSKDSGRFGGVCVFFWFWGLVMKLVMIVHDMLLTMPYLSPGATDSTSLNYKAKFRQLKINFVKFCCWLVFALTCFPVGGPQLLATKAGALLPVHRFFEVLSPRPLSLPTTVRGALGLVAVACDFI